MRAGEKTAAAHVAHEDRVTAELMAMEKLAEIGEFEVTDIDYSWMTSGRWHVTVEARIV